MGTPCLATQGARRPLAIDLPVPSQSFPCSLMAPADRTSHAPRGPAPSTRKSGCPGLPLSPRKMEARILLDRALGAHAHCASAQDAAPSAALSIDYTPSRPSCHLTGAFERFDYLLRLYLLRDNLDADGLCFTDKRWISESTAGGRTAKDLSGRWLCHFRGLTGQVRLRAVSAWNATVAAYRAMNQSKSSAFPVQTNQLPN